MGGEDGLFEMGDKKAGGFYTVGGEDSEWVVGRWGLVWMCGMELINGKDERLESPYDCLSYHRS
jgi:hypothetical protein